MESPLNKIWTPNKDLPLQEEIQALEKTGDINQKVRDDIFKILGIGASEQEKEHLDLEFHKNLLTHMKKMVSEINSDPEIKRNGFQYPEEWIDAYAKNLDQISPSTPPDIGIIGYGSLQSPESFARDKTPEIVRMEGVKRGLYISVFDRNKKYWDAAGMDAENGSAVMAVKHDPEAHCNGLRLPFPSTREKWKELTHRERCYEMLPGPPVILKNGQTSSLNLICWPMGRNLINKIRPEIIPELWDKDETPPVRIRFLNEDQKIIFMGLKTKQEQRSYLEMLPKTGDIKNDHNEDELEKGVVNSYNTRIKNLYSLDKDIAILPHIAYVHTCLNMGNSDEEEEFLDTSFCYSPDGEEITLREYLKKYAPKTNPKLRSGMDAVDGHPEADKLRTRSISLPT